MDEGVADKNSLLEHMMKVKKEEALHSSQYARTSFGKRIGSTSAQSFQARQMMEANRKVVRAYKDSQVGGARNMTERAATFDAEKDAAQREAIRERFRAKNEQNGTQGGAEEKKFTPPTWRNPGVSR